MRRAVQIIAAAVFLAGAAGFLGPYVNRWMADRDASDVIETFQAETDAGRAAEDSGGRQRTPAEIKEEAGETETLSGERPLRRREITPREYRRRRWQP